MAAQHPIHLHEGSIDEAVKTSLHIPEFHLPHPKREYEKRLKDKVHLILIASIHGRSAGFKVGYQKQPGKTFYSWMGGVLPEFRQCGVAYALASAQEQWALEQGFEKIQFKTRNHLKAMQIFALKNGFDLIDILHRKEVGEHRLLLEKKLSRI